MQQDHASYKKNKHQPRGKKILSETLNYYLKCHLSHFFLTYLLLFKAHKEVVRIENVTRKITIAANLKTCYSNRHFAKQLGTRSGNFLGQTVVLFQKVLLSTVHWSKTIHAQRTGREGWNGTPKVSQAHEVCVVLNKDSSRAKRKRGSLNTLPLLCSPEPNASLM